MYLPFGDHTGPSSSTRLLIVSYGFAGSAKYSVVAPVVALTVSILLTPSRKRFEYCCNTASAIVLLSGPHVGRPPSPSGTAPSRHPLRTSPGRRPRDRACPGTRSSDRQATTPTAPPAP